MTILIQSLLHQLKIKFTEKTIASTLPAPTTTLPPPVVPSMPQPVQLEQQHRSALEKQQALIQETLKKQRALEEQLRTQQKLIEQTLLVGKAPSKAQVAWIKDPVTTTTKPVRKWNHAPSTESTVNRQSEFDQNSNSSENFFLYFFYYLHCVTDYYLKRIYTCIFN